MLFRIAGRVGPKDTDRFTSRLEAVNIVGAISTARSSLNEAGVPDESITEIRARVVEGGSAIRFSKPVDPSKPKKARAAKKGTATVAAK